MKLTIHKNRFSRVLNFVERITSKNTTLPILSNILLQTEFGRLRVSATNLDIGISSVIGANIESEGKIAVPSKVLSDFIRNTPSDTISLEVKKNILTIQAGQYHTTILCFDASEYPIIPRIENGTQWSIDSSILTQLIHATASSISVSDSRPELSGAFMKLENNSVCMASTDIFRLAEKRFTYTNNIICSVIIPRNTIGELYRILGDISGDIAIQVSDNQISFSHEEFTLLSRIIDGIYPDYHKIIPEHSLAKVLVRKAELENAVKVAALFSSSISDIKLDCTDKVLNISGKNSTKGEAIAGVEVNLKGDPFEVSMNYRYFLDGLSVIQTEKVVLEFTGKGSPFIIRPHTEIKDTTYLIMPLRS